MSLTQSKFFCTPTNFSSTKLCPKTKVSLFPNLQPNISLRRNTGKMAVLYNGYSYFTSPVHPLEEELLQFLHAEADSVDNNPGIGIDKFYEGKNIFITGATGLVGKVLVEKVLRSTSLGKIYLMIKAEDKEAAFDRVTKEIIKSDLFKNLEEGQGKCYEAFVREKLIPVVGNICEPNLGMDSASANAIKNDVDVIIVSAASTTLNDRYDFLIDANVNGPQRLMRFAKQCKNLKLFAHISTAYVNGRREGLIEEKPLIIGENRRKEEDEIPSSSCPQLDIADELKLAMKLTNASTDYDLTKNLKKLGQERADFFGWFNAYHLTKAMCEMVLNEIREHVPLLIIRPAVIESCYKEPVPGWIQGNRMFDPVIISYGKGHLPAYYANPEATMDVIPVDLVANTTIAAIAKHGAINKPQVNAYQVSSGAMNPLKYSDFFEYLYEHFKSTPLVEDANIPKIKYFDNFKDFCEYTRREISRPNNGTAAPNRARAKAAYAEQVCKMYEFAGFFNARFDDSNTLKLLQEMSEEEKLNFEVDVMNIDWRKYLQEIHVPGLRKYIINRTKGSI